MGKTVDVAKKAAELTFGMKNGQGAKGKKARKQIEAQIGSSEAAQKKAQTQAKKDKEKEEDAKRREEDALLNRPAQIQKIPFGIDPKTVVCIFHRRGNCEKGNKCKFSHDLEMDRKTNKRDVYQDIREEEDDKQKLETSADWDEDKLRSVVLSKKGNQRTATDKVCKYFIEAIEDGKYGWFWICPNGGDKCMYKHALPPGFILKTKEQRATEKALHDKSPLKLLTLEEFLESERHKLTGTLTPVTPETFALWKQNRLSKKAAEEELRKAKEATGRALFESGNWRPDDLDSDEEPDGDAGWWNLEKMRRETDALREKREDDRLAALHSMSAESGPDQALDAEPEPEVDTPPDASRSSPKS